MKQKHAPLSNSLEPDCTRQDVKCNEDPAFSPEWREGHQSRGLGNTATPCKGGCGLQSAAQPLQGLSQENPKPGLNRPERQSARSSPSSRRGGGFRRAQPSPCQTSGGADTRDPERRAAPAPIPGPRWASCRCRRTYRGPQNKPPPPALPIPLPKRDKGAGEELSARGAPGAPTARARNAGPREDSHPLPTKARLCCPPTPDRRHSPMRSP